MRNVAIYLVMRKNKLLLHANPWINFRHVKWKKARHKRVYTIEKQFHFYDVQEKFTCSDRNGTVVIFAEEYDREEAQDSFWKILYISTFKKTKTKKTGFVPEFYLLAVWT